MEHLTQKQIEDYSLHRLGAAELLSVSDHLGECEVCRGRVEGGMNGDAAFFALHDETFGENGAGFSAHLTAEQTAEYVDKNLSGETLQMVTDHLAGCEQCVLAVADLRAFRNEIAPSLDREYGPATAPVPSSAVRGGRRLLRCFVFLRCRLLAVRHWQCFCWQWSPGWFGERQRRDSRRSSWFRLLISQPSPSVEVPSVSPHPEPATVVAQLNDGDVCWPWTRKANSPALTICHLHTKIS